MNARPIKDFNRLTGIGRLRRIGRLVETVIRQYALRVRDIRLHCFATNPLYRVRSEPGESYILRMAYPGWRTMENLCAEAAWLKALHEDTDIGAPLVIPSRNGDTVIPVGDPGMPGTWHATLMTWVGGRLLAHYLNPANLERMGELFARLHLHGKAWKPPEDFPAKRFEAFLSRGEPDALFDGGALRTFREMDRRAFRRVRERVATEYDSLDRNDLRVIHCDLWHENIKIDRGRLRPFDFEDTIWGYRLHDMAMGLLDLLETVGHGRYRDLLAAFRNGYERHLAWPDGSLEVLQMGRMLWQANYTARFQKKSLPAMSERFGQIFRNFEQSGELHL